MSESINFTATGFSVESVTQPAPAQLAVRYTFAPLQSSPSGVHDALNVNNYSLTGPSPVAITGITASGSDIQTVILSLSSPLGTGEWTLTASLNIQTPSSNNLTPPNTVTFGAVAAVPAPSPTPGVQNDSAEDFIRQFLNPALQGDAWTALIAAIATGDTTNWNNAEYAFDQLFITSASQRFLDRKLADDGIRRPAGIGLGDDPFRQLGIAIRNHQLTQDAILQVLEIFYGTDAVRASVETQLQAPFLLNDGDDLQLLIDGIDAIPVTFSAADFTLISQATATEVAVAITRAIESWSNSLGKNSQAFAVAVTNAQTGIETVRIYSGAIGLRSTVQVTGGKAQNGLEFPSLLPLPPTQSPSALVWNVTIPSPNIMRLTLTAGTMDLKQVHAGDYVNVYGQNFQAANRGSFPITNVYVAYEGSTLVQYLDVQNFMTSPQSGVTEVTLKDVLFFRPTKSGIQQASGRTVIVAQSTPSECDVVIPATTAAITRTIDTAAYLHVAPSLTNPNAPAAWPISRSAEGVVTVSATNHGLSVGQQIWVDNILPSLTVAQQTPIAGTPGAVGSEGTTDASPLSQFSFIRPGDQVYSSQHQTAGLVTLTGMPQGLQVGGHAINNNLELLAQAAGAPHTYTYTVASVGMSPSQPIVPLTVRLTYWGTDGLFAIDDGAGNLIPVPNQLGYTIATGGTVNYMTGVVTFTSTAEPDGVEPIDINYLSDAGTTNLVQGFQLFGNSVKSNSGLSWNYNYFSGGTLPHALERHSMVLPTQGNNLGSAVTFGGLSLSAGVPTFYSDVLSYQGAGNPWLSTGATLSQARAALGSAIFENNGVTVIAGGAIATNIAAVQTVDILDANQATLITPAPQLIQGRAEHETVAFLDASGNSQVMVIGGRTLAQPATNDPTVVALWHLDTITPSGSTTIYDRLLGIGSSSTVTFSQTFGSFTPIAPGTVQIYVGTTANSYTGGTLVGTDNGSGGLTGSGIVSGTVNYSTGAFTVTLTTAPGYNIYVWTDFGQTYPATTPDTGFYSYGYNLKINGPVQYSNGKIDNAFDFSGSHSGSLYTTADARMVSTMSGAWAVEAWIGNVQLGTSGAVQTIFDVSGNAGSSGQGNIAGQFSVIYTAGEGLSFQVQWQRGFNVDVFPGTTGTVGPFPYDTTVPWHHVAMVKSLAPTFSPYTQWTNTFIGTGTGSQVNFNGTLINVPLSPGSVQIYVGTTGTAGTVVGTDNGSGAITGPGIASSPASTVNYTTGAVDVYLATAPTSSQSVTAAYQQVNPSQVWNVQFYLDGQPVGAPLVNNYNGGPYYPYDNVLVSLGNANQTAQPFAGQLDDVRLSGQLNPVGGFFGSVLPIQTRVASDIYLTWLRGRGDLLTAGNGQLLASTETLAQTGTAWVKSGNMTYARSGHRAVVLPDQRILVTGGYAYKNGESFVPQTAQGVPPPTSSAEVYDPRTGLWSPAGNMAFPRALHGSIYLPSSGLVMVFGGFGDVYGRAAAETIVSVPGSFTYLAGGIAAEVYEYWNPKTGQWSAGPVPLPGSNTIGGSVPEQFTPILTSVKPVLMDPSGVVWIAGGLGEAGIWATYLETILTGDGATTVFTYTTANAPLLPGTLSIIDTNGGDFTDNGAGTVGGTSYGISWTGTVNYLTGTIVITWATPPTSGAILSANYNYGAANKGFVYIEASDTVSSGGLEGWQTITAVPDANTLQYETPSYPFLCVNAGLKTNVFPFAAPPAGKVPGPYVYDTSGATPGITSVQGVLAQQLFAGQQYETLTLSGAAAAFPDSPGYLVLAFGGSEAVFPVPYFGRFSEDQLSIDYTFKMPYDVPAGSTVTLLATKGAWVPPVPEAVGSFYLTDSNAGRLAAESTVETISGGGLDVNISITYPGDRGLGGEGLPATGQKFSDKVLVWGSNKLDDDEAAAREGINLQVED